MDAEPMSPAELRFGPEYREHHFFRVPDQDFVICAVTLQNGFTVVGQAGRVHRGNTSIWTLEEEALEDAFRKTGPLAAFRECERIHNPRIGMED